MEKNQDTFTVVGTNIKEVKSQNESSGMSYNEVKAWLAKTSGGRGTGIYSATDDQDGKKSIQNSKNNI